MKWRNYGNYAIFYLTIRGFMTRPDFITSEDILRWSTALDTDNSIPNDMVNSPVIREVCYAGYWLAEELQKLKCPEIILVRIQWTAGKMSYGRDPWEIHQMILDGYKNNTLVFESDDSQNLN